MVNFYSFSFSNGIFLSLLGWLTFLFRSLTVTLKVLLFGIYLFLLVLAVVLQWISLHWQIHVVSVSIDVLANSQKTVSCHCIAYDYSCANCSSLFDHLRNFHGRISLNSVPLLLLENFVSGFRLELIYTSLSKYQVKPHSSLWFSTACAAVLVYRSHFFRLYQQNKSEFKGKLRQTSNCCQRVLESDKRNMQIKQKSPSLPRNLARGTLGKLPKVFPTKLNLLYFLYPTALRCCLLYLIKQNYLLTTCENSNLDDSGISLSVLPCFSLATLLLHNIFVTPKTLK